MTKKKRPSRSAFPPHRRLVKAFRRGQREGGFSNTVNPYANTYLHRAWDAGKANPDQYLAEPQAKAPRPKAKRPVARNVPARSRDQWRRRGR